MESKKRNFSGRGGKGGHRNTWKDRRDRKRQRTDEDQGDDRANYEKKEYAIGSKRFDEYYARQFKSIITSEDEFDKFKKTLYDKLPVTFRVNPSLPNHQAMVAMFSDPDFIKKYSAHQEEDEGAQREIKMGQSEHIYKDSLRNI